MKYTNFLSVKVDSRG
uniref:Uncharacterized protein n=1 Tax=Rhizophora mucronata TaxID=61149 RepID=A0A2P2QHR4_RHIMU